MSRFRVVVTATAQSHIRAVVRWCVENDRGMPETFLSELDTVIERIGEIPRSGHIYQQSPIEDVFRILLRRSAYHVYFTIDDEAGDVIVRAVWYAGRGTGPRFE
jgi:plasmid stabilization system protein ParE